MTVVVVVACKGSPGATSVASRLSVALAKRAHRRYPAARLLELDPDGGDLALSMGLDPLPGLATLAQLKGRGLSARSLTLHSQRSGLAPGVAIVPGSSGAAQRAAVAQLARPIATALRHDDIDAVLDVGRATVCEPLRALLEAADELLLVCRGSTASIVHARSTLLALGELGEIGLRTRVVVVDTAGDHADELATALGREVAAVVAARPSGGRLPLDGAAGAGAGGAARRSGPILQPDVTIEHLANVVVGELPSAGWPQEPILASAPLTVVAAAGRLGPRRVRAGERATR